MSKYKGKTNEQAKQLYEELKTDAIEERNQVSTVISTLGKVAIVVMLLISVNTFIIRNLYLTYLFNAISIIFPCIGIYLYLKREKCQTKIALLEDEYFNFYINNTEYLTKERKERILFKYQKATAFNKPIIFLSTMMEESKNKIKL